MNHLPKTGFAFELSVSAVILFYLITGHLMALKFGEYVKRTSHPVRLFLSTVLCVYTRHILPLLF